MSIKKSFLVVFVVLSVFVLLVGCDSNPSVNGNTNGNTNDGGSQNIGEGNVEINSLSDVISNMSALKYFKANIDSSTAAIGMEEESSSSKGMLQYLDKILVKLDEGSSTTEPIEYTVVNTKDSNGNDVLGFDGSKLQPGQVVSQSIIPGKLDKVYVAGDYTFVSYLTVDTYKLMNYKENRDNGNNWFSGNIQGDINYNGNNGGTRESIWWSFPISGESLSITYNYARWWNDSDGKHHEVNEQKDETVSLRTSKNDYHAPLENEGVSYYDTFDYYTSKFRESFIIDNKTGLIYSVGDMDFSFQNGVAIDEKLGPVSIETNSDGTLQVEQLVGNSRVYISHVFKDKYGQYYIYNDSLSEQVGHVMFFKEKGEYIPTKEGIVLHLTIANIGSWNMFGIASIAVVGENFSERALTTDDSFIINYSSSYYNNQLSVMPNALRLYNETNGNSDYWSVFQNNNSGTNYTFFNVKDGKLYCFYPNGNSNLYFSITDISENYNTKILSFNSNDNTTYFSYLDEDTILVASKENNSYNLYSYDVTKSVEEGLWQYIVLPNGEQSYVGSDYDSFRKRYSDLVGISFGSSSELEAKSDYSNCIWGNYYQNWKDVRVDDYDYTFYKKNIVCKSFGSNPEYEGKGYNVETSNYHYEKNTSGIMEMGYLCTWKRSSETKTTFGYDPTMEEQGYEFVKGSNYKQGIVHYLQLNVYTYYKDGEVVATRVESIDPEPTVEYDNWTSEQKWIYFENGVRQYDYDYIWSKWEVVATSNGFNPEYAENGWRYSESDYALRIPDYIQDYDYTYYDIIELGTVFGNNPDPAWDYDSNYTKSGNWHSDIQRRFVYDYDYEYYKFKDGYGEDSVRALWNKNNGGPIVSLDRKIISGVVINSNNWNSYNALDMTFDKVSFGGSTTYKIVFNDLSEEYNAVEFSSYVAEKHSVTLQPINR
mgnify:CR=1 FL=1